MNKVRDKWDRCQSISSLTDSTETVKSIRTPHIPVVDLYYHFTLLQWHKNSSCLTVRPLKPIDSSHTLTPAGFDFTPTVHNDTYPAINPATKSDCTGKHVFITGASKGIGRALALAYAKAGAAAIGLGARSDLKGLAEEIPVAAEKAGKKAPKVLTCVMDVADRGAVENTAKEVESSFGRLDILVNNAGYLENFDPIAESDPDEWWKTWTIVRPHHSQSHFLPDILLTIPCSIQNVRGLYLCTRAFLPLLLKSGDKTIVNLTSIGAHDKRTGASAYQTGKLAVMRFTEFIMAEYEDRGVLAWCCHPGGVMTELARGVPENMHHREAPIFSKHLVLY